MPQPSVSNSQTTQTQQKGVILSVRAPKHSVVGKPFIVEVDVKNHSQEVIYYRVQPLYPDLHIKVQDDQDVSVPQTRFGQKAFPISYGVEGAFVTGPLPVGKSFHVVFDLTRVYDLSLAGQYKLTVAVDINPAGFDGYAVETSRLGFGLVDPKNLSQK